MGMSLINKGNSSKNKILALNGEGREGGKKKGNRTIMFYYAVLL